MSHYDIESLLDRYVKGETTPEENKLVEKWLAENNNNTSEWQRLNQAGRDQWLTSLFSDIQNTIYSDEAKVVTFYPNKKWWRSIAAVLAIILTLFLTRPLIQNWLHPVQLATLSVPLNQKQKITLSDGSNVWINAASVLKYPTSFNGKTREVYLTGEAYFDIRHDSAKPFIVHTGKVLTTVLGTAFNINAGKNANTVVVTVTRGKVSVADGKHILGFVTPNQQIAYDITTDKPIRRIVNAQEVIAWQESDLLFDDITFAQAAKQLEGRFKVNISFANDKVKNCRFSGTALKGKSLDEILKVICAFNNASYHRSEGYIIIDGNGCDK